MKKTILYYRSSENEHIRVQYQGSAYKRGEVAHVPRDFPPGEAAWENNVIVHVNGELFTNYTLQEGVESGYLTALKENLQQCMREKAPAEELTRRLEHLIDTLFLEPKEREEEE